MKQNLLIVDGNEMMRSFLSHYFKKHYHIKAVGSTKAAWHHLDQGHYPDLILLDIRMPNKGGMPFLNQLKESVVFNDIPVIILSGISKSSKRVECLMAGAADYVTKPFNPKELEVRIQNRLTSYTLQS